MARAQCINHAGFIIFQPLAMASELLEFTLKSFFVETKLT
jgi:hypothetical protein